MNSITGTGALNATMAVSGVVVGALALTHATFITAGLSAKVGAAVADRFGYQDAAQSLRNGGDACLDISAHHIKADLKIAAAFTVAGLAAFVGLNYFASLNDVMPNPFNGTNATQFGNNSTNFTGFSSNFTDFGSNSSNTSFFSNFTNKSFY